MAKVIVSSQEKVEFNDKKTGQPVVLYKITVIRNTPKSVKVNSFWTKDPVPKEYVANPFEDDFIVCDADIDFDEDAEKLKISNIRPETETK